MPTAPESELPVDAPAGLLKLFAGLDPVILTPASLASDETRERALRSPGAYLLAIDLPRGLSGTVRGTPFALAGGRYFYAGSANGPGGIAARLARHFRHDKIPHWHVDQLTLAASDMRALAFPGGSECELVARLAALADFPLPGFGSSDCRSCPSHLLSLGGDYWIGGS